MISKSYVHNLFGGERVFTDNWKGTCPKRVKCLSGQLAFKVMIQQTIQQICQFWALSPRCSLYLRQCEDMTHLFFFFTCSFSRKVWHHLLQEAGLSSVFHCSIRETVRQNCEAICYKACLTLTPKVTNPGPLAFGLSPSTLSFSVGSDL